MITKESSVSELQKTVAELTAKLNLKEEELSVINGVQQGLAARLSMDEIYTLVGDKIRDLFDAQVVVIRTYDHENNLEQINYAIEKGERLNIQSRNFDDFARHLIKIKKPLLLNQNFAEYLNKYSEEVVLEGEVPKSALFVPMISGDVVIGNVSLQNIDRENAFTDSDVNLLETLANSMTIALESARLFDETNRLLNETEQRNAELAVINSVQESLVAQMDIKSIYDLVGEKIREIFNAQVIDIVTYDSKSKLIEDQYSYEKGDRTLIGPREPNGFRKHVIETSQVMLINKDLDQIGKEYDSFVQIGEQPKSAIFVPLIAGGEVTGIISLQNLDHENAFSDSDVILITTLANSMSVALKSARLFDETNHLLKETEQRNAELAVINSVQESLVAKMDIQGIYEMVGEKMREIFNAQVIDIVTYDKTKNRIEDQYAFEKGDRTMLGPREPKGFRKHVIETGVLLVHNDNVEQAMRDYNNEILIGEIPKSQIYVPMNVGGEVRGVISLQNLDHEHAFSESDITLLSTLVNSMSVALENARLFDETTSLLKETEQRTAELAVINSVQEGLARELDIQSIYDLVGDRIRDLFNAQAVIIANLDIEKGVENFKYVIENGKRFYLDSRPLDKLRQHLIKTRQKIVINKNLEEAFTNFGMKVAPGTELSQSVVFVPLTIGEKITSYVSLQNVDQENAFSEADIRLLETLANSMSVALENARLFDETNRLLKETEQRTAELAVINSVQEGLARELDIQAIYDLVGDRIRDLFNAQAVIIANLDVDAKVEYFKYVIENGERFYLEPRPLDKLRKHLVQTKQKVVINNPGEAFVWFGNKVLPGTKPMQSGAFVPLIIGEKITSYISLQNVDKQNAFSDSDIRLLETLANSMSVALENARLFDETNRLLKETEQRTSELAVINSVQEGLVAQMEMQSIYDLVGEKIRNIFQAQIVDIVTYDKNKNLIEDRYAFEKGDRTLLGPREPLGFRKYVIQTRQVFLINEDLDSISRKFDSYVQIGEQPKSALFVPMIAGGELTGIISLQNLDHENAFSESAVSLLTTLANSMSVALGSAGLFDETKRLLKETEQRTAELAVINSVQEGLAKELDMQAIYEMVGNKIRDLFDAQAVIIASFDHETGFEHFQYHIEKGVRSIPESRPFDNLRKHLIKTRQKILINKSSDEIRSQFGLKVIPGTEMPKSLLFVPLIVGDKIPSYVSLQNIDKENAFSDSDVRLLETLANSMSVALENARLFDETTRLLKETEQRTAELAVINSVQEGLAKELDMEGIYNLVGDRVQKLFNAQAVIIATFDVDNKTEYFNYLFENQEKVKAEPRPINKLRQLLIDKKHTIYISTEEQAINEYGLTPIPGTQMSKSLLYVPLLAGNVIRGYVSLQNIDKENAFSVPDIRLLETLAHSMSVALENARLFDETNRLLKETEQRTAELAVINSVQEGLAKELDIQAIYDLVGNRIRDLFDAQVVGIATFDYKTETEHIHYLIEKGERYYPVPRPLNTLRKHLIQTKEKILINKNFEAVTAAFGLKNVPGTEPPKSAVYVPLMVGEKVTGNISLQNVDKENAISDSDVRLLETLANSMSVALENARLFDETNRLLKETEQQKAELGVINSVQEGLAKELNMQAIYDLVGDRIRELFNAQAVMIVTFDHETATEHFKYLIEDGQRFYLAPRPYDRLRQHLIVSRQKIVINSNYAEAYAKFGLKTLPGTNPTKSGVFVPLIIGDKVNSYISLQNMKTENAFSDSDIRLLETLANSMSVALENARLFDETNRLLKETEQGKAELAVINSVQEGLVREMDIQGIYNLVGDRIQKLFNAQVVIIATFNLEKKLEYFNYHFEKGEISHPDPRHFDKVRKHLIETGQNILINEDVPKAAAEFGLRVVPGTEMPKSLLFMPLKVGDKVNGYVSLQNIDKENAFSFSDVRLLSTLSNSMSVALENARLFDETNRLLKETEQRTAELAVINSVQEGLAKELDMQGIYNLVGDRVQKLFKAQVVIIATFDSDYKSEYFNYLFENNEKVKAEPRSINKLRQLLIDKKHTIYIPTEEIAIKEYGLTPIAGTQITKTSLFVPLLTGNIIRGYVSLQNIDIENAFSESDIRLLETLANSMSVALENARLFDETSRLLKETEQRTAELAVINSVQDGLAKELDMQGIYNLVGDRVQKLFNAQAVIIASFDFTNRIEHFNYLFENGEKVKAESRPINKLRQLLIDKKHSIYIPTEEQARNEYGVTAIAGTQMPRSLLFVPMLTGNIIRGYVSLQNIDIENAFSQSDIRLLETLSNSMSVALENARLFDETNRLLEETEQRTAELGIINSVQEGLASKLDIQAIYDLVGDKIRDVFDTQGISISYYDRQKNFITHPYYLFKGKRVNELGFELGKGLTSHIIQTAQPLLINENASARFKELGAVFASSENEDTTKSWLGVPLISGGKVNGTIRLENYQRENAYTESDVFLLQTLANSMSVALENARLFDETTRLLKETEQRTAELVVINSVQEGLAKELDMKGIYDLVGDRLCDLFPDSQTLVIRTFDHETGLEHWQFSMEKGVRQNVEPRKFNWNSQQLILTKKPLDIKENYVETAKKHGGTGVTQGQPPKSAVFVPMVVGDVVKGSVSLQNVDKENAFTDADMRLLTTITNSMSVALENARLFDETSRLLKETEQRTGELAVINSVQEGLVREMNIKAIYTLVGNRICELFDTQTLVIRTFDYETGLEHYHYTVEKGSHLEIDPRPIIWANKQLIETKQSLLINKNYLETAKKFGGTGVGKGLPPKSALFVPMVVGDVVKGSVSLQNVDRENAFTESDLRLLTTLTNSMSVALENARLFDETTHLLAEAKQRASELSTVNSISKALASQLDTDDLIKMVGDQLKDLFIANIIYMALLNKKTKTIHFPYQFGDVMAPLKLGEGLTSKIILSGEPLLINKNIQELSVQLGVQRIGLPSASYLGVPIPVGDEIIGVLSVQSTEHENQFNENDLRLLSTIASSVGVALSNAQLFEEVQQSKMEAEAASKVAEKANEAKSAFLSTVSHELRTPLTSVLGFAKIIRKRLEEKIFPIVDNSNSKTTKTISQISENLQVVISEGERLTHLINDVLDLAKIEAGKMEWNQEIVSMSEVAERAIAATTSLFDQKSLKLIKQIDDDLPEITGDKDKLIQVIINLISNSVKFTNKGSVTCKVYKEKGELIVSISDTGIGIAPEDFDAVFEQFKQVGGDTLTDKPKGTGLGLPICKEIVEHHGGRIWLESKVNKGSTFSFALPVTESEGLKKPLHLDALVKQLKEQMAHSKLSIIGKVPSILVVDDDDSIRSLLHQELSDAGYLIDEATNGKQALECVRKNRPDLIILDVMMPEMNGFDVAAILKNDPQTMDIPIIVLSIVQDKARGYRIGVDRYLTKPIDTSKLFAEVGILLEQGKSKKKVMIVDEDSTAVRTLTEVLHQKGYHVVESDGKELVEKAISTKPDIIILNSMLSDKQEIVQSLRFEKGLENVLFLIYQ